MIKLQHSTLEESLKMLGPLSLLCMPGRVLKDIQATQIGA